MTRHIDATETAKLVRAALKAEHPDTKFSVRTSKYAGGASLRVAWTDGPTERTVNATLRRFQGATFDGMRDLKEYHSTLLAGPDGDVEEVRFGADFVHGTRSLSDEAVAAAEAGFAAEPRDLADATPERCRGCGDPIAADAPRYLARNAAGSAAGVACSYRCAGVLELREGTRAPDGARVDVDAS